MALKILESGIYSHNKMFVLLECIEHTQLLHLFINMIPRLDLKIILRTFQNLRIPILHKPKIDSCLDSSRPKINRKCIVRRLLNELKWSSVISQQMGFLAKFHSRLEKFYNDLEMFHSKLETFHSILEKFHSINLL